MKPHACRVAALALLLLPALIECRDAAVAAPPTAPSLVESACDVPDAADVAERLRCGTVHVSRDYAHPHSGTFALSVVIAKSAQRPALPDPVIYISGGPGEPLTVYAAYQARHPYAAQRDLVLIDQRGTGRSEPDLCRDLNRKLIDESATFPLDGTQDAEARLRATYKACRDEAVHRGIDLADFGTRTTAEDIDQVRQALGIERWNAYGESYGTTVAMTLMALHPNTLRSVVLDSVYPPDPMPLPSSIIRTARTAFFAACTQDATCSAATPDLAGLYRDTLQLLAQTPLIVAVPPRMQMPDDRVRITAPLFEGIVSQMLYYPTYYATLPAFIARIHDGQTRGVAPLLVALKAAASTQDIGLHAAVQCRDRPHYRDPLPNGAGMSDGQLYYGVCWDWAELGPPPLIPQGTSVPTLVLGGQFDAVAGSAVGREVAEHIGTAARWVAFAGIGHNVRHFSACGARIAFDFIGNPDKAPDTACASRMAAIFATRQVIPRQRGAAERSGLCSAGIVPQSVMVPPANLGALRATRRSLRSSLLLIALAGCSGGQTQQASLPQPSLAPNDGVGPCSQVGIASWYRGSWRDRASPQDLVAAHRSLPFGTSVRVTAVETGQSIVVRINDRGPFGRGRIIDLSRTAADQLGIRFEGVAPVRLEPVTWTAGEGCPFEQARSD